MQTSLLNNNSSGTASTSGSTSITGNTAAETRDMFTKLLVAQIQNQDPLSPSDPAQFVQQLTQLSQTESLQNLSTLTSANASVLQSMQVLGLGAQVGAEVTVGSNTLTLDASGQSVAGQFNLASASSKTTLVLTGSDGFAHEISLGTQAPGTVSFSVDPKKLQLPAGNYTMKLQTSSNEVPSLELQGRLNSVRLSSSGAVVLNVANVGEVSPAAITAFNGKTTATPSL